MSSFKSFLLTIAIILNPTFYQSLRGNIYYISDVLVDVTAASAIDARTQAIIQGQRQAFRNLLQRIVPPESLGSFDKVTDEDLDYLIKDFEVVEERNSNVRYIATLNFNFDENAVQEFLKNYQISPHLQMSKTFLIIPIFHDNGKTLLWEDHNPWLMAWNEGEEDPNFKIPLGDLSDRMGGKLEDILEEKSSSISALLQKYHTSNGLVCNIRKNQNGIYGLDVRLYTLGGVVNRSTFQELSPSLEDALRQGKAQVKAIAEKFITQFPQSSKPKTIELDLKFRSFGEWQRLREKISHHPLVQNFTVKRVSAQNADAQVIFLGSSENLIESMAEKGLEVLPLSPHSWSVGFRR